MTTIMVTKFIVHQINFNLEARSVVDQREGDKRQREIIQPQGLL